MSLRTLYLAVGTAWGVLLGTIAGLAMYVFVFGGGWLHIVDGDAVPATSGWIQPVMAMLAGLVTVAACAAAGRFAGEQALAAGVGRRRARQAGLGLLGLWAVAVTGLVGVAIVGVEQDVADQQTAAVQEAEFSRLYAERHTIDRIDFFGWNAENGTAGIVLRGNRSGDYQVEWQVNEPKSGHVLAEGHEMVTLELGRRIVVINLDRASLITAYRETVPPGATGAVFDGVFRLTATVEPVPSPAESASLPPRELQDLAIGQSTLRSAGAVDVPVSFRLSAGPAATTD